MTAKAEPREKESPAIEALLRSRKRIQAELDDIDEDLERLEGLRAVRTEVAGELRGMDKSIATLRAAQ